MAQLPRAKAQLSPLPSPAGLHPHRSSLIGPEHTWATCSIECDLHFQLLNRNFFHLVIKFCNKVLWCPRSKRQWQIFTRLLLEHVHLYRAKSHLFQPCQGQQSVPCLGTYGALTLVKQTGLWGLNVLRHGTDCWCESALSSCRLHTVYLKEIGKWQVSWVSKVYDLAIKGALWALSAPCASWRKSLKEISVPLTSC